MSSIVTITGTDRPGITARLLRELSRREVQLLDVEQNVFRGTIGLAAYVSGGDLSDLAKEFPGLEVSVEESTERSTPRSTHVVVVLGRELGAVQLADVAHVLASHRTNIDRVRRISDYPLVGFEIFVSVPGSADELRRDLAKLPVDIAIERAGLARRGTRLVCFDCDSTLITGEVIEMLAAHAGREEEVAEVTARAMRGELDFAESLRERVATLEGLDASVIDAVIADVKLTPGARTTIATLRKMGYLTGVVSGGFTQVLEPIAADLGIDYTAANELEIVDGKLTGRVVGDIVDREAKAEFVRRIASRHGLRKEQTVAVGDGANDIDMISAAGFGIAFNAKPALREVADTTVDHPYLDEVLYMLGIPRTEVENGADRA